MFMTTPEVSALLQNQQPTSSFLQIIEGYEDIESVVAVLETQETFDLQQNLARYRQDTLLEQPEAKEKLKYLGFFLTQSLQSHKPFAVEMRFAPRFAYIPLVLMLKGFGLRGKKKIHITQGLILHEESTINTAGIVRFHFEPLSDWIKDLNRVRGFMVYLLWPRESHTSLTSSVATAAQTQATSQRAEAESGIIRARPGLNVYRKIDTRV